MTRNYVNDTLLADDDEFRNDTCSTFNTFDAKERTYDTFTFLGSQIAAKKPGWYSICQFSYVDQLQTLVEDKNFRAFCRSSAILAWRVHSRPDFAYAAYKAAQVTEYPFEKHITEFNKVVLVAKTVLQEWLLFKSLNHSTFHLHVYAGASF